MTFGFPLWFIESNRGHHGDHWIGAIISDYTEEVNNFSSPGIYRWQISLQWGVGPQALLLCLSVDRCSHRWTPHRPYSSLSVMWTLWGPACNGFVSPRWPFWAFPYLCSDIIPPLLQCSLSHRNNDTNILKKAECSSITDWFSASCEFTSLHSPMSTGRKE